MLQKWPATNMTAVVIPYHRPLGCYKASSHFSKMKCSLSPTMHTTEESMNSERFLPSMPWGMLGPSAQAEVTFFLLAVAVCTMPSNLNPHLLGQWNSFAFLAFSRALACVCSWQPSESALQRTDFFPVGNRDVETHTSVYLLFWGSWCPTPRNFTKKPGIQSF